MKDLSLDLVLIAGLCLVAVGAAMVYVPAGVIAAGGFASCLAWFFARGDVQ